MEVAKHIQSTQNLFIVMQNIQTTGIQYIRSNLLHLFGLSIIYLDHFSVINDFSNIFF